MRGIQLENSEKTTKTTKITKTEKIEKDRPADYKDIEDIVEYLVKVKSRFYAFDVYTDEDIAQEIRIICFKALEKFDPDKVGGRDKWQNFFGRCVDNGLKNLKRDNYIRASFPYRKKLENLDESDNSKEAVKIRNLWNKFQDGIKAKLGIIHAKSINVIGSDRIPNDKFEQEMEYRDLERYILEKADDAIVEPLSLILAGRSKEVSKGDKRKVHAFIRRIMDWCDGVAG